MNPWAWLFLATTIYFVALAAICLQGWARSRRDLVDLEANVERLVLEGSQRIYRAAKCNEALLGEAYDQLSIQQIQLQARDRTIEHLRRVSQ